MAARTQRPTSTNRKRKAAASAKAPAAPLAAAPAPVASRRVYVLSDSTGNLARHMLGAFLTQFDNEALAVRFETFVRTPDRLREVLEQAKSDGAAVCHAMVSGEFKKQVDGFCSESGLPCRDLTGGIVEFLSGVAGSPPLHNVDALHRIDDAYKRRIGALEFTLTHDDGLGLETIHDADVVLTGVSRTSKTPTSIYLAQMGYRVANVSLAMGVEPPRQLLELPAKKVVGLIINPAQLMLIRTHRRQDWQMGEGSYGDPHEIARELAWARRLFTDRGWNTINVTDQAIEETSARVVELAGLAINPLAAASGDME